MNYQRLFLNLRLNNCLDIGAHTGHFSLNIKKQYPDCKILMIEANPFCEPYLKKLNLDYQIIGLSSSKGTAELFLEKTNNVGTGSSFYRENTEWYEDDKMETVTINLDTLDNQNYFPDQMIDLVKIDVQGSELDILNGGEKTIKRSKYVLLEVSTIQYNINAPLMDKVVEKMKEYEFRVEDFLNYNKLNNGQIFQMDILFKNSYV
jgi:FkbM family methyltransferase